MIPATSETFVEGIAEVMTRAMTLLLLPSLFGTLRLAKVQEEISKVELYGGY
jgi:hypothetical protein